MGHCSATHPLEMPRNFYKIFHIAIACGLITVSHRVVQSWHPQDVKLSYEAVWTVYSNTFVLYRMIWNILALISLQSYLHCFHLAGCKMAVGNMPPPLLSCYSAHLLFPKTVIQGWHMQLYISDQLLPVALWHHTHLQHHFLNSFLASCPIYEWRDVTWSHPLGLFPSLSYFPWSCQHSEDDFKDRIWKLISFAFGWTWGTVFP